MQQREHTVQVELRLGKFRGMFEAIIDERIKVIEGLVISSFSVRHAKNCKR
jgi:hypothetical protein